MENKSLAKKTIKQKKTFEEILESYKVSFQEVSNLKDLFNLATQEKDEEIIEDCKNKLDEIFNQEEIRDYLFFIW